jgi:uncharacterized protein YpmB
MSGDAEDKQGLLRRRVPRKWLTATVAALIIVIAIIAVTLVLVDRSHDQARRAAQVSATSTPTVTSPYDLTELPAATDLGKVKDAAFVSIFVPNKEGKLTSYGVTSELPAARALSQAIQGAKEVTPDVAATLSGATGTAGAISTVTFVFEGRETLTFTLDLDHGLIGRQGKVWRPEGDLKALVAAAVAGP